MTEHEYDIDVLCVCYAKETLKQQLKKKDDGAVENYSDMLEATFWSETSSDELEEAISCYDEEQYKKGATKWRNV